MLPSQIWTMILGGLCHVLPTLVIAAPSFLGTGLLFILSLTWPKSSMQAESTTPPTVPMGLLETILTLNLIPDSKRSINKKRHREAEIVQFSLGLDTVMGRRVVLVVACSGWWLSQMLGRVVEAPHRTSWFRHLVSFRTPTVWSLCWPQCDKLRHRRNWKGAVPNNNFLFVIQDPVSQLSTRGTSSLWNGTFWTHLAPNFVS